MLDDLAVIYAGHSGYIHVGCTQEFARLLLGVVYATYVGVAVCLRCISTGLRVIKTEQPSRGHLHWWDSVE